MPGYRVGPLSFITASRGYGLVEFDTTGLSASQQLVVTDNGGVTWQAATSTPLPSWASTLEFNDPEDGYAWGSQGLDVTHDGGDHWVMSLAIDAGTESVSPIGQNIWAISSGGALETTVNGGSTWEKSAVQPPGASAALMSRVSTNVAYVLSCGEITLGVPQRSDLARTEDGGLTWQLLALPPGCSGISEGTDLVALSADDLWLVQFGEPATDMSAKSVYRSYDGGQDWTLMASVSLGSPNLGTGQISAIGDFGLLSVLASDPNRAWLAEDRGGLLVSRDGGLRWQSAYADPETDAFGPPYVSFLDAAHGWAATGNGLWRTTDGSTWSEIAPPPPSSNQ